MKKIICCILLSVCLCFTLVGCDITEEAGTMDKESIQKINNNGIYEFIDHDTGVHYWIYAYGETGGMTPRLNSDGTVMVTSIK